MRQALWMGADATTLAAETGDLLQQPEKYGALAYGVFVALQDGRAQGFVEVSLRDDIEPLPGQRVGYIEGIYVEPRAEKKGLGRALVDAAEAWSRTQGCRILGSDATADNLASIAFHERLGFRQIGERKGVAGREVIMAKGL